MRIGLVSTAATRVAATGSGSVEALVWLLSRELVSLGHEVTVFAPAGSSVAGELVETLPGPYGRNGSPSDWHMCEWLSLTRALADARELDVLHSHVYLWGIPLERLAHLPLVHTLHVQPHDDEAQLARTSTGAVVAVSAFQWEAYPAVQPAAVVHHGVDSAQFPFEAEPQDYLCYLGRFTPGKGPLHAIRAAREIGMPIKLAGPTGDYFDTQVRPLLDGRNVEYVGTVTADARADLLGKARAVLYPLAQAEPFGLVMVESMMCGTPVLATRVGAVSEIVEHGRTGSLADSAREFAAHADATFALERGLIRESTRRRFASDLMARRYASVYETVVQRRGFSS